MLACRAASTAARSRGLEAGSGRPERAAVVSSRISLVKILARFLSCAPLRYMMFLNCEWPAISIPGSESVEYRGRGARCGHQPILSVRGGLLAQYGSNAVRPEPHSRSINTIRNTIRWLDLFEHGDGDRSAAGRRTARAGLRVPPRCVLNCKSRTGGKNGR